MQVETVLSILTCLLTLAALGCLPRRYALWRRTTLAAPLGWLALMLLAFAVGAAAELSGWRLGAETRYLLMTLSYCPLMALMGARRPHHRAWIFIVLTFWVVLSLPAIQVQLTRPGDRVAADGAWALLLLALAVVSLVTVWPSAMRPAGCIAVAGQWLLTLPALGWLESGELSAGWAWGRTLLSAGVLLALLTPLPDYRSRTPFDGLWLRFRDAFGGLWALRMAERMNAFFVGQSIPLRLRLQGLVDLSGDSAPAAAADEAVQRVAANLLRRFVAPEWLPPDWVTQAPTATIQSESESPGST